MIDLMIDLDGWAPTKTMISPISSQATDNNQLIAYIQQEIAGTAK